MTALLVVGSAPCAHEDYAKACVLYPDHETMLVNGACAMIENAEHMLSGHTVTAPDYYDTKDWMIATKAFTEKYAIEHGAPV